MQIIGIPLNTPDKKTTITALATAIIAGLPAYILIKYGLVSSRNAVLIVTGAIAGLLAPNMGIDPKKHGPKAWVAFSIFGILIFLCASILMEQIPGLKLQETPPANKNETTVASDAKKETPAGDEKMLTEIVVKPSDNERLLEDRTITRSRFDAVPEPQPKEPAAKNTTTVQSTSDTAEKSMNKSIDCLKTTQTPEQYKDCAGMNKNDTSKDQTVKGTD